MLGQQLLVSWMVGWLQLSQLAAPKSAATSRVHDLYTSHFSSNQSSTEVYLQTQLGALYPNTSVVTVLNGNLDLQGYAASTDGHVVLSDLDDIEPIKRLSYSPPARRRDGEGVVSEQPELAGYRIQAGQAQIVGVYAQWVEPSGWAKNVWFFIGPDEVSKALVQGCAFWSHSIREAVLVFDQSRWQPDRGLWRAVQKVGGPRRRSVAHVEASWDDVILDDSLKSKVQNDYRSFFKSETVYKNLGVPWKRGLIFLGPPGNGKTISLKAIMHEIDVPILYVKSFHTYGGDELGIRMIFQRARAEAPCLLVFEDLDSLITDMNRSFFLNEVDGLEDNDGLLMIGTTNHFDKLDPALSSRPSRFDRKYNFPNPTQPERRQYAQYWQHKLHGNKDIAFPDDLLDEVARRTDGFSFAYLKEVFVSSLLVLAGREPSPDAAPFRDVVVDQIEYLRKQLDNDKSASEQQMIDTKMPMEPVLAMAQPISLPRRANEQSCVTVPLGSMRAQSVRT